MKRALLVIIVTILAWELTPNHIKGIMVFKYRDDASEYDKQQVKDSQIDWSSVASSFCPTW